MPRDQVFISYSHRDKKWLDELNTNLKPYLRNDSIASWSDQQIAPGSQWFEEIQSALTNSKIAVLKPRLFRFGLHSPARTRAVSQER